MNVGVPVTLSLVAFAAGVVDAIAGGGGLLTLPALLFALHSPQLALGTNKGQSVFGSAAALASYARAGHIDRARVLPSFVGAFVGSLVGVRLVLLLDPTVLRPVVLGLLAAVAIFFAVRPTRERREPNVALPQRPFVALTVCFSLGVYDGFFGPGVGTMLIAVFAALFGDDLISATANAKVSNFASNLGSVLTFALAHAIVIPIALPMAVGQALGGVVGARLAVRGGARLVRIAVLAVTLALVVKLAADMAL